MSNHPDPSPKKSPKKGKGRKIVFWSLITLLGLILCALMVLLAIANYALSMINRPDPTESYISESELLQEQATEEQSPETYPTVDPDEVDLSTAGKLIGQEDELVNILLVGQDRRPGEGRARSDSMILCSFNKTKGTLHMISFLRDLYVPIPGGYMDNRLNAAYAMGGFELLDATLEADFGVQIDANIEVDFSGFTQIVDIMGGVDIELTGAEARYLNNGGKYAFSAGVNHLDGTAALSYSRIRYLDSDFKRTDRQRNVMTALFNKVRDIDLSTAKNLVDEFFPLITTDMTNGQIISYVTSLLPMLSDAELISFRIPADDGYYGASIRGMSVLVPDMENARELLIEALGE